MTERYETTEYSATVSIGSAVYDGKAYFSSTSFQHRWNFHGKTLQREEIRMNASGFKTKADAIASMIAHGFDFQRQPK